MSFKSFPLVPFTFQSGSILSLPVKTDYDLDEIFTFQSGSILSTVLVKDILEIFKFTFQSGSILSVLIAVALLF